MPTAVLINQTAKWWRLAACCPKCRRRPRIRLGLAMLTHARTLEPDDEAISIQCHGRDCDHLYTVAAVALQHAEPDQRAA